MRDDDHNDVSTSRIERIINRVARQTPAPVEHSDTGRIMVLEAAQREQRETLMEHGKKLTAGEVMFAAIHVKAEAVQESLNKINSGISKLVWSVLAAVVAALLHLVIKK